MIQEPKVPATVVIKYDGQDITANCSVSETTFTTRAGGAPGQATVVFKDTRQRFHFIPGKTLELLINGVREWDGYALSLGYNYWFGTHTADCEPCPHVTPRKLILYGVDRNILLHRRVLYNKADPTSPVENIWPANTSDQTVIIDSVTDYLDDLDGVDYTTKVEHVGSPDPYVEFRVPGPTNTLAMMLTEIAQATGGVFYIDPDRYLVYTDVNTPDAPWVLTDVPNTAGDVGYREVELVSDGSRLINDAMIWGAGQGSSQIVFRRVEDAASIAAHGRWQNTGGYRTNLWQGASVERVANSILYGSPSNKRGHKDPVQSVRCTTFHHGFRVAQKATVEMTLFSFSDVIPIREMTISFINPTQPKYDLVLSHEIDEPWTISEYWWPTPTPPDTTIYDPPPRVCTAISTSDTAVATSTYSSGLASLASRTARLNNVDWFVFIEAGQNYVTYYQTLDGEQYSSNSSNSISASYGDYWSDTYDYGIGTGGNRLGDYVPVRVNSYRGTLTPTNVTSPGAGLYMHLTGNVEFSGTEGERDVTGHFFPIPGWTRNGEQNLAKPCLVMISLLRPRPGGETSPAPHTIGSVVWEGMMSHGDSIPLNINVAVQESDRFYIGIAIYEINATLPWVSANASISNFGTSFTEARSSVVGIPPDEDGIACVEYGYGGASAHNEAVLLYGRVYRLPFPYVAGTTRVYIDGIHTSAYSESSPLLGEITLDESTSGTVTVAYTSTALSLSLPEADGYFQVPTTGPISGTFGSQMDTWPPAYWNGVYYEHFHNGVDFGVSTGTPVYAAAEGEVRHEDQAAGGTMIHIYHPNGMRTVYAHLSGRAVADGSSVSKGELIGWSGSSGVVTGPHLHWGLVFAGAAQDPLRYI